VRAPRTPARGFAEVGVGFLVPHRAWLAILRSAQVVLLGLHQGIVLHPVR
jgi:hypothetical protein